MYKNDTMVIDTLLYDTFNIIWYMLSYYIENEHYMKQR